MSLLQVILNVEHHNSKPASLRMAQMTGAPVLLRNTLQAMLSKGRIMMSLCCMCSVSGV